MNTEILFSSNDMTWETPLEVFSKLNNEFNFTLDVCCSIYTAKCKRFFTPDEDGLIQDWSNDICWMNPPYGSDLIHWMKKAYEESLKGAIVVALIPSRTDTRFWHDYCMKASEIRFIKSRLKFGDSKNSAPFPSAIIVFDRNKSDLTVSTYTAYGRVIQYALPKVIRHIH